MYLSKIEAEGGSAAVNSGCIPLEFDLLRIWRVGHQLDN